MVSAKTRPSSARICEGLGFLGIEIDDSRNSEGAEPISKEASRVAIFVLRKDEELMVGRSVRCIVGLGVTS